MQPVKYFTGCFHLEAVLFQPLIASLSYLATFRRRKNKTLPIAASKAPIRISVGTLVAVFGSFPPLADELFLSLSSLAETFEEPAPDFLPEPFPSPLLPPEPSAPFDPCGP